ncbi:MAG: polysaccharide deacetylase family protein [Candidatus Zixiibacteriota bacterium]|nr:MAG: polysaccharide deacetylase family protein [candidate division Zixibacteria bacterium]
MKRFILKITYILADLLGINLLFRYLNSGKMRILMYHGISSGHLPTLYWTHIGKEKFTWQMKYLKRRYNVVPGAVLTEESMQSVLRKHAVVITFDDGLESVYTEAWPILKKYRLTAVCFVLPGLSESGRSIWTDYLYEFFIAGLGMEIDLTAFGLGRYRREDYGLHQRAQLALKIGGEAKSWPHEKREQLLAYLSAEYPTADGSPDQSFRLMTVRQIQKLGSGEEFTIAPHSNTHPILSTMTPDQQEQEICKTMETLVRWSVPHLPLFAYPNGRLEDFDRHTVRILQKMNIKAAVTTEEGFHDDLQDRFRIKRIPIGADVGKWEFKARMSGLFYFLLRLKNHFMKGH